MREVLEFLGELGRWYNGIETKMLCEAPGPHGYRNEKG